MAMLSFECSLVFLKGGKEEVAVTAANGKKEVELFVDGDTFTGSF